MAAITWVALFVTGVLVGVTIGEYSKALGLIVGFGWGIAIPFVMRALK